MANHGLSIASTHKERIKLRVSHHVQVGSRGLRSIRSTGLDAPACNDQHLQQLLSRRGCTTRFCRRILVLLVLVVVGFSLVMALAVPFVRR